MPEPIKPIHQINDLAALFEPKYEEASQGLSEIQITMMGGQPKREAGLKLPPHTVGMLDAIYKNEDEIVTAATTLASGHAPDERIFRVPTAIHDSELLGLKAQGLVSGSGRVVSFTDNGKLALRDTWLTSSNAFNTGKRFVHPRNPEYRPEAANWARAASADAKFKRVTGDDTNDAE
jgi:hypothetical protein